MPKSIKSMKIADRPHRWTIILGLIAPVIGIVALVISFFALRTNQSSLQVSQRAYLGFDLSLSIFDTHSLLAAGRNIIVNVQVTIKNLGNTPAYLDKGTQSIALVNSEKRLRTNRTMQPLPAIEAIAPKSEAKISHSGSIPKVDYSKKFELQSYVEYSGEIHWHDAFGASHLDTWCFAFDRDSGFRQPSCAKF